MKPTVIYHITPSNYLQKECFNYLKLYFIFFIFYNKSKLFITLYYNSIFPIISI